LAMFIFSEYVGAVISVILLWPLSALILWLITRFMKLNDISFKTALFAAGAYHAVNYLLRLGVSLIFLVLIAGIDIQEVSNANLNTLISLGIIFIVVAIINFAISVVLTAGTIKLFYKTDFIKTISVGGLWFIANGVAGFILGILLIPLYLLLAVRSI